MRIAFKGGFKNIPHASQLPSGVPVGQLRAVVGDDSADDLRLSL